MTGFRWPDTSHDIALAREAAACRPTKPLDWEAIATRLNAAFSTEEKPVTLKGRGCRERLERLLGKFKAEDAKSLKRFVANCVQMCVYVRVCLIACSHTSLHRSGTEEEYSELTQLLKDISSYLRDRVLQKSKGKESKRRECEEDKVKTEEMRKAAVEGMSSKGLWLSTCQL